MLRGIRMTHLSVDPACNTSLLVNKLVERFILWFAGGDPRQGIRSLHSLCIHRAQLLTRFLSSWTFVGWTRSGEHVWWIVTAGLHHPTTPHGQSPLKSTPDLSVNTATIYHCTPMATKTASLQEQLDCIFTCSTGKWNWRTTEDWNCSFLKLKLGPFCKHCQHKKFNSTN